MEVLINQNALIVKTVLIGFDQLPEVVSFEAPGPSRPPWII